MAMEINVEIINKQTIKPSSPTPIHLKNYELSLLDQLAPVCYGPLLFFYSSNDQIKHRQLTSVSERFQLLKQSLSETLTRFYPLAGRIKDANESIECNDSGVVFVEAKVNSPLFPFLEKPEAEIIRKLIAVEIDSPEAQIGSLVHVQITCFACGGLAIGVCVSQKISDAITATAFIKDWAEKSSGRNRSNQAELLPLFKPASTFPPQNFSFKKPTSKPIDELYVTKRFVFDRFKIASLQAKAVSESVQRPTRVEAVTGLIWKCAMNSSLSNADHSSLSILSQSVNLRRRMVPSIPEQSIGNLAGHVASQATECDQIYLPNLVSRIRKGMQDFDRNYVKKLKEDNAIEAISESFREAGHMLQQGNIHFYISTSLCRFPFYGIDFGWGKPEWVTIPSTTFKNVIVMLDAKDGDGIEAWVTLTEEDMAFFERDHELLAVACLNPSVLLIPNSMPKSSL